MSDDEITVRQALADSALAAGEIRLRREVVA